MTESPGGLKNQVQHFDPHNIRADLEAMDMRTMCCAHRSASWTTLARCPQRRSSPTCPQLLVVIDKNPKPLPDTAGVALEI